MKRKTIPVLFALILISAAFIMSCGGDDSVSSTTNSNCGLHHSIHYGPLTAYTNTYLSDTTRIFQFSAIPTTTIGNLCTHTEPEASGFATWLHSVSMPLNAKLVVSVNALFQPYQSYGAITPNGTEDKWEGVTTAGLEQSYGEGPGEIVDLRVDFSFRTFGSLSADESYMSTRGFSCDLYLAYDDYKAASDNPIGAIDLKRSQFIFETAAVSMKQNQLNLFRLPGNDRQNVVLSAPL